MTIPVWATHLMDCGSAWRWPVFPNRTMVFLARRLLSSALLLWGVVTLSFFLIHAAPGDPVDLMTDPALPEMDVERLRERFGLDEPLTIQYLRWIGAMLEGDLGLSLRQARPVRDILAEAIPMTLRLSILALLMHYTVGTALGLLVATRRGSGRQRFADLLSLAVYSLPTFWLGLMLQLLFCYHLRWLPTGGTGTEEFAWSNFGPWLGSQIEHLALPLVVLGLSGTAGVARYMRGSLLEILHEDFIRTARAKGLPPRLVFWKHALRNAAIPLVTLLGLSVPFLLSGAVATEVIFSWPGMGRVAVDAIFSRDYPVIMATTTLSAALVILGNLLADLGYALVDPRIRVR